MPKHHEPHGVVTRDIEGHPLANGKGWEETMVWEDDAHHKLIYTVVREGKEQPVKESRVAVEFPEFPKGSPLSEAAARSLRVALSKGHWFNWHDTYDFGMSNPLRDTALKLMQQMDAHNKAKPH